ncbi:hypothetical protein IWX90DRAFT_8431 [Phyllosticta citrichinensis]|uniref:BTB domain-containing protein n=1 Tax=Phyllosticta citrichinensis TaxID=1130410 RepID=A0ABR1Y5Q6_9PEZI
MRPGKRNFRPGHISSDPGSLKTIQADTACGFRVTIVVGPEHQEFEMEMRHLTSRSPFFAVAFQNHWKEGRTGVLVLEDTDPEVFELFEKWIRTRLLPQPTDHYLWTMVQDEDGSNPEELWDYLMSSAYVFATIYEVNEFAEAILQQFTSRMRDSERNYNSLAGLPKSVTLSRLFREVPTDSPLCEALAEETLRRWARRPTKQFPEPFAEMQKCHQNMLWKQQQKRLLRNMREGAKSRVVPRKRQESKLPVVFAHTCP